MKLAQRLQRQQAVAKKTSAAEMVVARFDSYTPEQHAAGIKAARERAKAKDEARRRAAREAFERLNAAS